MRFQRTSLSGATRDFLSYVGSYPFLLGSATLLRFRLAGVALSPISLRHLARAPGRRFVLFVTSFVLFVASVASVASVRLSRAARLRSDD